jgi:hypothetical protein
LGCPIGFVLSPALVSDVPLVDATRIGPIRCAKCGAFFSSYNRVLTSGRAHFCPFCSHESPLSDVPDAVLVSSPVYDLLAPPSYVALPDVSPCFCFLVDISAPAFESGFTSHFLASLRASVSVLADETLVCLATFGEQLSCFDLVRRIECVIADLDDVIQPPVKPVPVGRCRAAIADVIDRLRPSGTGNCLPAAFLLADRLMERVGGVLVTCCVNLPRVGPHPVAPRTDDILGLHLRGDDFFFREIARVFSVHKISVHLFASVFDSPAVDIATLGLPSALTSGLCHRYSMEDIRALHQDLFATLSKQYLWNCSLRMRCSGGVKVGKVRGNFLISDTDRIDFPVLAIDQSIAFDLVVRQPITQPEFVIQVAMSFTSDSMRRILRIFTFRQALTADAERLRASLDEFALISFWARVSCYDVLAAGSDDGACALRRRLLALLKPPPPSSFLCHLVHALLGSRIFSHGDFDRQTQSIVWLRSASLVSSILWLYPRIFALDAAVGPLPAAADAFRRGSVLLFHTNQRIYIWVGEQVAPEYIRAVFGHAVGTDLPEIDSNESRAVRARVAECQQLSGYYLPVDIIPQGDPREMALVGLLVDTPPNQMSLEDWITRVAGL